MCKNNANTNNIDKDTNDIMDILFPPVVTGGNGSVNADDVPINYDFITSKPFPYFFWNEFVHDENNEK